MTNLIPNVVGSANNGEEVPPKTSMIIPSRPTSAQGDLFASDDDDDVYSDDDHFDDHRVDERDAKLQQQLLQKEAESQAQHQVATSSVTVVSLHERRDLEAMSSGMQWNHQFLINFKNWCNIFYTHR
jgi:hypothetical protein